jgi:hypothetical protein
MLRMVEGHRTVAQTSASWIVQGGMDLHLRGCGIQPGANAESEKAVAATRMKQAAVCLVSGESAPQAQKHRAKNN